MKHVLAPGLLAGLVLLVVSGPPRTGEESRRVRVTRGDVEALAAAFRGREGREPTASELRLGLEDLLREELLHREALARGLDRDGPADRGALVRRMEALSQARPRPRPPSEEDLHAYRALRPERYRQPAGPDSTVAPAVAAGQTEALPWDPRGPVEARVALDLEADERDAAGEQFFHQLSTRYRIVLDRRARALLERRPP